MSEYKALLQLLPASPRTWLITGVAGFIGSNLLEVLLNLGQRVVGLDNFSTGYQHNLDEVKRIVGPDKWSRFHFIRGDVQNIDDCFNAMYFPSSIAKELNGIKENIPVEYVLHQAALGSVPRSINDPIATHNSNVNGFLNILIAARDAKVKSFTYAASSSTYGDHASLPKVENIIGKPLSPYAVTKYINELYADVFDRCYGLKSIGLRYFNVFGKRQNPKGEYAAVIPKWISAMMKDEQVVINGDGETSRDFCFIENVIQMNILAALALDDAKGQVYNVAVGERTTLNELYLFIKRTLISEGISVKQEVSYSSFRSGDVRHSLADISKARNVFGYSPQYRVKQGIEKTVRWYLLSNHKAN